MDKGKINKKKMILKEWEIWHTYSSFIQADNIDLKYIGKYLVELGVAELVFNQDGTTLWRGKEGIGEGTTKFFQSSGPQEAEYELEPLKGCNVEVSAFVREVLDQAANFRFSKYKLFGEDRMLPPSHIRAFLGQCNFIDEQKNVQVVVYPNIILYETGVITVEFRTISPPNEFTVNEFINYQVNLFKELFDKLEVPPGISVIAPLPWYEIKSKWNMYQRLKFYILQQKHANEISKLIQINKEGDFTFEFAPLSPPDNTYSTESLSSLFLTLLSIIAFISTKPRSGLEYILFGQKKLPEFGKFWSGRPHIYLIKFDGQKETSTENEDQHKLIFGKILMRANSLDSKIAIAGLPEDSRAFTDYATYIDSQASLWVWSLSGLNKPGSKASENHKGLISEPQTTMELLEYNYMLHRKLLESIEKYINPDDVIITRKEVINLEQNMSEVSYFGEISKLLDIGWQAMGLPALKLRIKELLSIQESQLILKEARVRENVGRALTVLFGMFAIPTLSNQIIKPIWEFCDFYRPDSDSAFSVILLAISLPPVGGIVFWLFHKLRS